MEIENHWEYRIVDAFEKASNESVLESVVAFTVQTVCFYVSTMLSVYYKKNANLSL